MDKTNVVITAFVLAALVVIGCSIAKKPIKNHHHYQIRQQKHWDPAYRYNYKKNGHSIIGSHYFHNLSNN